MKKILILILLFLLILCSFKDDNENKNVDTYKVKKITLKDVILQTGEVMPLVKVELKSEASGKIEKVYVKEGQRVKKGDKILDIDPFRLLTRKKKIDLALRKAEIQKNLAERNYQYALELREVGTISVKKLEDLKSTVELKTIDYQQQLLEVQDIKDQLRKTTIVSPMDGVVTKLDVDEGEIAVSATSGFQGGTNIGTIADISKLEIITKIGEVDYINLKKGQNVIIRLEAIENASTTGKIDFISLSAKKANANELGNFEVRVSIDSLIPGISPGINVNVEFVIMEKKDVLGVPYHYVQKRKGRYFVIKMVKIDGKDETKRIPIKVGKTDYKHYELLDGLKAGDKVVFSPQKKNPGGKGYKKH